MTCAAYRRANRATAAGRLGRAADDEPRQPQGQAGLPLALQVSDLSGRTWSHRGQLRSPDFPALLGIEPRVRVPVAATELERSQMPRKVHDPDLECRFPKVDDLDLLDTVLGEFEVRVPVPTDRDGFVDERAGGINTQIVIADEICKCVRI